MSQFVSFRSVHQNCHHHMESNMSTIDTICSAEAHDARSTETRSVAAQPRPHAMRRLWAFYLHWLEKREGRQQVVLLGLRGMAGPPDIRAACRLAMSQHGKNEVSTFLDADLRQDMDFVAKRRIGKT